jgi:hypothetical protein
MVAVSENVALQISGRQTKRIARLARHPATTRTEFGNIPALGFFSQ